MNLHNEPEDVLCREIWSKRSKWCSHNLTDRVFSAVRDKQLRVLVETIDELVDGVANQRNTIVEQTEEILRLEDEIANLRKTKISPPARREDLDMEKMKQLYQEHHSYRKVGELLGCDGKTIKNRLKAL